VGSAERPTSRSEYRRKETEILFEIKLLLHYRGLSIFKFDDAEQVFRERDRLFGG
jgi:hypothetical protein